MHRIVFHESLSQAGWWDHSSPDTAAQSTRYPPGLVGEPAAAGSRHPPLEALLSMMCAEGGKFVPILPVNRFGVFVAPVCIASSTQPITI